jgi:hypothetical protein
MQEQAKATPEKLANSVEKILVLLNELNEYDRINVLRTAYTLMRSSLAPRTFDYLKEL